MKKTPRIVIILVIVILSSSFALIRNYISANNRTNPQIDFALIQVKCPLHQYPEFHWNNIARYDDTIVTGNFDFENGNDGSIVYWRIPKGKKVTIEINDPFLSNHLLTEFIVTNDTLLKLNRNHRVQLKDKLQLQLPYAADTIVLAYAERGCFSGEQKSITCIRKGNKYNCTGNYHFYLWQKGMKDEVKFKHSLTLTSQIDSLINSYNNYVKRQNSPFFCGCTSRGQLAIRCRNEYVYLKDIYCCKDNTLEAACKKLMEFK